MQEVRLRIIIARAQYLNILYLAAVKFGCSDMLDLKFLAIFYDEPLLVDRQQFVVVCQ